MGLVIVQHFEKSDSLLDYFNCQKQVFAAFKYFDAFCAYIFDCPGSSGGVFEIRNSARDFVGGLCWRGTQNSAQIYLVVIKPEFREHGYGKFLLSETKLILKSLGLNTIWCLPSASSESFYITNGFRSKIQSRLCVHSVKAENLTGFDKRMIAAVKVGPGLEGLTMFQKWRFVTASTRNYWLLRSDTLQICKVWQSQ